VITDHGCVLLLVTDWLKNSKRRFFAVGAVYDRANLVDFGKNARIERAYKFAVLSFSAAS
jgi:hypothetical protein